MKMNMYQLPLFHAPVITVKHGKEWIWAYDSMGYGRFFSRPAGSRQQFYNRFAGPPDHPKSPSGNGEAVDYFGNLVEWRLR